MPANVEPIYSRLGDIQWSTLAAGANNTTDLTSGTIALVFSADATNGGFIREIRVKPVPGTTNTATAIRVWINNGATTGTASNNIMIGDFTFPAFTASTAAASPDIVYPMMLALPAGYRVYCNTAQTATAVLHFTGIGGKY